VPVPSARVASASSRPTIIEMILAIEVPSAGTVSMVLAVAHHGDAVGDALHLVHLVGDVDDADAVRLQLLDDRRRGARLRFRSGRMSARP
jgi:hypothetical protein